MLLPLVTIALLLPAAPAPRPQAQPPAPPAPAAPAKSPAKPRLDWQHDWKGACERAAQQKRPILVFLLSDSEPVCQKLVDGVLADADAMRKLQNFVLLVASPSTHELVDREIDGRTVKSCARYPGVLCSEHNAVEAALRDRFLDPATGGVVIPQLGVFDAGGTLLMKHPYSMKREGFMEFLASALAAGGNPADVMPADTSRSPAVLRIVEAIVDAKSDDEREHAAGELFADSSPERESALQEALARLKRPADRGVVVRAAGSPDRKSWAPAIAKLLADKERIVRNCAVVTLEEERNPAVAGDLLDAWAGEKDEEIRKDLLRALGPCGAGSARIADVKQLLTGELASPKENHRIAAALSLGTLLPAGPDVAAALEARWPKETNRDVRVAIVWGIGESGDAAQAERIDRLIKSQKDDDLAVVAGVAKERLHSNLKKAIKSLGKGGGQRLKHLLGPIYDADKVPRNFLRDYDEHGGKK
jgi:HEAT repeat protein